MTNPESDEHDLSVADVRAVLLSHRYAPGEELTWVGGTIRSWDAALVIVTLSDGTTGVGEAGAGIMAAQAVPGLVEAYRPYIQGRSFASPLDVGDHLRAHTAFWSRGGIASGVAGALETAVLDAAAKRSGVPAYDLLGGARRPHIEAYASGGLGTTFDEVSAWAEDQVAAGFGTVKFRAMEDADTTLRLLDHVVSRLPDGTRFIIDAVQACASHPWTLEDAIRVGRRAAELGARWYEEPCQADDVEGYAAVRRAVGVAVSGVESNGTEREFAQLLDAGALDIAQPDVTFVGGPRAFSRVARRAHEAGAACVPHVWGSAVTFAANLHTVLADPYVELFEYCTLPNPLRDALLVEAVDFRDGRIHAPTAPGLGVEVTADVERDFAFRPGGGHVIR
ncbi:mandelate racemase/muconate lactonizing enzyme family protein [Microbacterium sp. CFBP9034]|uniref:mandelate racemase/muconate lactonizing enzyme family protein n=1 Tax=Microbacterium sp. CFBP9034 TaxID=3096540 RepID=UPI002A6AE181|nr:mandelate racemase/muconate lactonizing enzyme family protein [Microbacterium sp. CFBP9034]MDY0908220.1 mandelate racemase/muconate lactonizing enzyme family protein [Microbacterium sp. CFBP9034]